MTRSSSTVNVIATQPSATCTSTPGSPFSSHGTTSGSSPNRLTRLSRNRPHRAAPVTGRIAACTTPPPSLITAISGASDASSASRSPAPSPTAMNRGATSSAWRRSAGGRGRGTVTWRRARCSAWRQASSVRPDGVGDGVVGQLEHVVEHQHRPLDRGQPLEQHEEPHRQRLPALHVDRRVAVGGHRLRQPLPRVVDAPQAGGPQHVERRGAWSRSRASPRARRSCPGRRRPSARRRRRRRPRPRPGCPASGRRCRSAAGRVATKASAVTRRTALRFTTPTIMSLGAPRSPPPRRTGSRHRRSCRPDRPSHRRRPAPRDAGGVDAGAPGRAERRHPGVVAAHHRAGHVAGIDDVVAPVRLVQVEHGLEPRPVVEVLLAGTQVAADVDDRAALRRARRDRARRR